MTKSFRAQDVVHVGDGVHAVFGSDVTWVVVKDGDSATLIDTGYPGDRQNLLASLESLGLAPEAVTAVLLTHAHNDHLGSAEHLRTAHGIPILMHEDEVPHARRDYLDQVTLGKVLANSWRPGVTPWALRAVRSGGTADVPVAEPRAFPSSGALDLPGNPVPVHTGGHTAGHCAYLLPDSGILLCGDVLVTGHPTSRVAGPQILPAMFANRERAAAALSTLADLDADVLVPGHGPVHRGPVKAAVESARERVNA